MTQYDPFTGMPFPGQDQPYDGPRVADAYKMGGLANLAPSQTGSIFEHTYPTPPEQVFGGYDKALVAEDKARNDPLRGFSLPPMSLTEAGIDAPSVPLTTARDVDAAAAQAALPTSPSDYAMYALGGPAGRAAMALGATFDPSTAEAGKSSIIGRGARRAASALEGGVDKGVANWTIGSVADPAFDVSLPARDYTRRYAPLGVPSKPDVDAPTNRLIQTVREPYRMMFPGVYGNPRDIAQAAAANIAPEDPMMKRLFGVTRDDLEQIGASRAPSGEGPQVIVGKGVPRGATSAQNIMTPKNEQRLQDILYEGGRIPDLRQTDAWYIMDPLYQQFVKEYGDQAPQAYRHWNYMTGMASPSSDVLTEIQRGTGAHWLQRQGRFDDFMRYGGVAAEDRGANFPADMQYIGGHAYHGTAQAPAMQKYLAAGDIMSQKPKVPLYVGASGVPETGYQNIHPVGDAHWSRGVGLADTREGPSNVAASFTRPEWQTLSPWWRDKVAGPLGMQAVPAQARLWNILAPQTGVETAVGAGKLELLSQQIAKAAARLGVSPETARDMMIKGTAGAGVLTGAVPIMGGLAAQDQYSQ